MKKTIYLSFFVILVIITTTLPSKVAFSEVIKTEHWDFDAGLRFGKQKAMVQKISGELDSIWKELNEYLEGALPAKLKLEITDKGFASKPILEEKNYGVELNAIHLRKDSPQDAIVRIAHESTHIALFNLSNGKNRDWENRFLDEGIATYVCAIIAKKTDYYDHWSQIYAKEDVKKGMARLEFLRDWEKNVYQKQVSAMGEYMRGGSGRVPKEEEFHQKFGYRSYYTSYSFVKFFKEQYDLKRLLEVLRQIGRGDLQSVAFEKVTGKSLESLFTEWHDSLK